MNIGKLLAILSPLILASDLLLFLWGEVICDVESLSDFLRRLSLNHVGDRLASDVKERLDIKIVGCLREGVSFAFRSRGTKVLTRMISNSISWSTCINFWSHSSMSVVFFRLSESSSTVVGGSFL
jgi:hypothetical protein